MYWSRIFVVASIGLVSCSQSSFQGVPQMPPGRAATDWDEAGVRKPLNLKPVKWPMKFKGHNFTARCFDTLSCSVWYAGLDHGNKRPSPPSSKYGPGYLDAWNAGHGGIHNFPKPAVVTWVTRDGKEHKAEIDVASIFRDELIVHNVLRKEISDLPHGEYPYDPSIYLEVNDVKIRVYMRAYIPMRHPRDPGNPNSDYRDDLILVATYSY